ncbi:hypothetical protein [Methylomonas albis]|nr:hypothetical protein [Methylomonas albis]
MKSATCSDDAAVTNFDKIMPVVILIFLEVTIGHKLAVAVYRMT